MMLTWINIFLFAMIIILVRKLIRGAHLIWKKLLAPNLGLGIDLTNQGKWAIITGATDGIGLAFANALARKGLDIILVSRSLPKLEDVSTKIKEKYGVETRIVQADLTQGTEVYSMIAKATEKLEVGILINSAGMSYEYPEFFTNVPEETLNSIMQLNIVGLTGITKVILPGMVERNKGVIINISSVTGDIPSPYLTVYAASKAYVIKFSADLGAEVAQNGVTVQCVVPGPVATKMTKIKKPTWMAPTADKFVEATLKTVGIESLTTGYPPHYLVSGFVKTLTCVCKKGTMWLVTKTMLSLRENYLRKELRKQEQMRDTTRQSLRRINSSD